MDEQLFEELSNDLVVTSKTFGLLRNVLIEQLGLEKAKRFLLRFGKELGIEKAEEILSLNASLEAFIENIPQLHTALGHVSNVTHTGEITLKNNKIEFDHIVGIWHGSFEVPIHLDYFGLAEECSCYILSGFASGILSQLNKEDIFVREMTCKARGDEHCTFDIQTRQYWEDNQLSLPIYDDKKIVDELEFTFDQLVAQKKLLNKVMDFHSSITETIAQQNDLQLVLREAYSTLKIPVFITDLDDKVLYREGLPSDFLHQNLASFGNIHHTQQLLTDSASLLVTPIQLDFKTFAYCFFLYEEESEIDANDHLFLERLAVAASLCFLNEKIRFETTERLKINFLDHLVNQSFESTSEIDTHAKYITPRLKAPYHLLSINLTGSQMYDTYAIVLELAKALHFHQISGMVSQKNDHILLFLYDISNYAHTIKQLKKSLIQLEKQHAPLQFKSGVSNEFSALEDFQTALQQAEQAMNFPKEDAFIEYASLGFFGTLLENLNLDTLTKLAYKELAPLLNTREKNQDLLYTLYVFLKNSQHLEKTTKKLALSIGGIKYRIAKIEDLLAVDLKDATTAAHLLLLLEILILLNIVTFD